MKKLLALILSLTVCGAWAEEYGTYADDESWEYEETVSVPSTPECLCDNSYTAPLTRENYIGIRFYKNEHASYAYDYPNGHHDRYTTDNFGFGTTMGNRLTDFARVEFETLYMGTKYTKTGHEHDYDIWGNFLNAYLFREYDGAIAPYAGLGIGLTGIWGDVDGELDNAFDLSYQAMVGVLFELNPRIELDLGFKYANFGRVQHKYAVTKVDATQIYIGAAYKFGM